MSAFVPEVELAEPDEQIFTARGSFPTNVPGEDSKDRSIKRYIGFIFLTTMTFIFALTLTYIIQAMFTKFFPQHTSLSTYLLALLGIVGVGIIVFYIGYRLFNIF